MYPSWVFHRGKNFNFLPSAYVFSEVLNPLDYDSTHPKNPYTLEECVRKYRKDKGFLCRELASGLGVTKFTIIKWKGGRLPHPKYLKK